MPKTDNYYIAPMSTEDAKSLQKLMAGNTEHFGKYLPVTLSQNKTLEASKAYIHQKSIDNESKSSITFAIKTKTTNVIAGLIIIKNIDLSQKQGEFAYGIGNDFQGRGWTTGAVRKMLDYGVKTLGLDVFQIITHKTNIASCRVAEKNGFTWKRTLKKEFTPTSGSTLDMELYELNL